MADCCSFTCALAIERRGNFSRDTALYMKLHTPMAIIDSGPDDIAYGSMWVVQVRHHVEDEAAVNARPLTR
jgi:hypothetical protein